MLTPVYFDADVGFGTVEVKDVGTNRMLAAKLEA
jgi:hypothetical protein